MSDRQLPTARDCKHGQLARSCEICELEAEIVSLGAELERVRGENYTDLLDQMGRSWGNAREIGREEINAFLETRIVHKPTTRLRSDLAATQLDLDRTLRRFAVAEAELASLRSLPAAPLKSREDLIALCHRIIDERDVYLSSDLAERLADAILERGAGK